MEKEKSSKRKRKHSRDVKSESTTTSGDSTDSESISEDSDKKRPKKRSHGHKRKEKEKSKKHKSKERGKKRPKKKERISTEDYFVKSVEFRTWLAEDSGTFFNNLSSEESRKLFKTFVQKWNDGLLDKKFYQEGMLSTTLKHSGQTTHKWNFAANLDKGQMSTVRNNVSSWTSTLEKGSEEEQQQQQQQQQQQHTTVPVERAPLIGPVRGPPERPIGPPGPTHTYRPDIGPEEEEVEMESEGLRKKRKDLRKHQEMVLDELLPKATGREAMIEKKRVRAEKKRDRELSPEIKESVLMGGGGEIQRRIQVRQEAREKKASVAVQKISDYQAKEKARMEALLEMARANKKDGAMW
ncbi:hypothetical protein EMCRGX_G034855 [Ephydatia muelleri]|eukprot:Em0023g756a